MSFQHHYVENPLKINQMNMQSSDMLRSNRPNSDPSYILGGKPLLLQHNPYVKSMLYERENAYPDIHKNTMGSKSLYINNNFQSSETEAIDKIYENLSNYEKTFEEMANAKLDDDFREEMVAIEQWFTVLSECQRTTVLYSLIQNISELQMKFFITVLQQNVKKNSLYNSFIKRPVSDSIHSSSTKHCSNDSSENSSMINSSSNETYYDEDEYQKNNFVESNLQNKTPSNQFACPLNMNEYSMALNSLSNVNLLNERTSSLTSGLTRQSNKTHTSTPPQQTSSSKPSSTTSSRKNSHSYMNTMMNDYNSIKNNSSNFSVLLNSMAGTSPNNQTMMNSQFLGNTQTNLMVNNKPLYSTESPRMTSFTNNSLLNQSAINSLINTSPFNKNSSTSALPVLSPSSPISIIGSNDDIFTSSNNPTSPIVSPIRPPKSTNNNPPTPIGLTSPIAAPKSSIFLDSQNERDGEKEKEDIIKRDRTNSMLLHEFMLESKDNKESNKNASILSNILSLSKEMNDMVNKNKERKKEKQVKNGITSPSSKAKKILSDEDESTILALHSSESVAGSTFTSPSREKGKIPDQIDLEMLEGMYCSSTK